MEVYGQFESQVRPLIASNDFESAVGLLEKALAAELPSPFQQAIGQSWVSESDACARWIRDVAAGAAKEIDLKAMYCEMNRFEINTDEWHIDGMCYPATGNPLKNWDWICGWKYSAPAPFVLHGFETLQAEFEQFFGDGRGMHPEWQTSAELTILIVSTRMQELVHQAVGAARRNNWVAEDLLVLAAVHDTDLFMVSGPFPV